MRLKIHLETILINLEMKTKQILVLLLKNLVFI